LEDHLSPELLAAYRERRLEPAQLLALDDHVIACPACREMLREIKPRHDALASLRASLETAATTEGDLAGGRPAQNDSSRRSGIASKPARVTRQRT
jgi:anti-sigma factor RsiW